MKNYSVIVFGGDTFFQYRLNDVIANSINGFVNDEYAYYGEKYYFPVTADGDRYFIEDTSSLWAFSVNGVKLTEKTELHSGDYIIGKGREFSLGFLLIDYSYCSLASKAYRVKDGTTIFLGRADDMNVVLNGTQSISRKHGSIRFSSNSVTVDDLSGKTGVFVNGKRVTSQNLFPGDHIFIMGSTMIYYPGFLIIPANIQTNGLEEVDGIEKVSPDGSNSVQSEYSRTPRIYKPLASDEVKIDRPPAPVRSKEMPFILRIGPSLTMAFAMLASLGVTLTNALKGGGITSVITSGVMAVSMLLGALLWPKLISNYNKRQEAANEKYRRDRYHQYLAETEKKIKEEYDRNSRIWTENLFPAPGDLIGIAESKEHRLWERSEKDSDFLTVRLGLGDRPFEVAIKTDEKGFELYEDDLEDGIHEIVEKYRYLHNVPVTLSLKDSKVVGVFGDYLDAARSILVDLTTLYAPEELKIVLVCNRFQEDMLSAYTDLPHMWSADRKTRYFAASETEAHSLFATIGEIIESREEELSKEDVRSPHFVFLIFDERLVANDSFKKVLLDTENTFGVSSVFFGQSYSDLPRECTAVVQQTSEENGLYLRSESDSSFVHFRADSVPDTDRDRLAKALSAIRGKQEKATASIPESVSFLDVFQVGNVNALGIQSHWATNRSDKSLAAPIGVAAGGERFYLDIHEKYHGCHGLVAGTTGSGKSEFLQAFILSLMINYSPNEVAFVLVDFKGGDMARPFLKSPHLAATISNLSGNILHRALVSLEAEVKSRQQCFNETASVLGIDKLDINSYQRYFKEGKVEKALPHLIIIIDEFAQLKTQHPEFMSKLIDVAQVGRSLGIHLILATQKPSGVVDPQIWSNSRFKVCLKVMDKQDSMDMINHPVAAMIKQPGRAYVQVGYDEIFEQIQSGYSGADYIPKEEFINDDSITVNMIDSAGNVVRKARDEQRGEKTELTQLEAVMKEIESLGEKDGLQTKQLWLEPLSEKIRYEDVEKEYPGFVQSNIDRDAVGRIRPGILDLIQIQRQDPFEMDFLRNGSYAVYGASGTGKSTFIQTVVYGMAVKYSPKKFQTFVMDFNGGSLFNLSRDPHCVYYVTDENEKEVINAVSALSSIIKDRQRIFTENDCANYESYLNTGAQDMPLMLFIIDNYAALHQKMYNAEDRLMQIIASASRCGIYMILTGNSKGAIYYKALDQVSNHIVFTMNDADSYRDILGMRSPISPEGIKGRALTLYEKTIIELQIAVPFNCDDEATRMADINAAYDCMAEVYGKPDLSLKDRYSEDEGTFEYDDEDEPAFSTYTKAEVPGVEDLPDEADALVLGIDVKNGNRKGVLLRDREKVFIDNRVDNPDVLQNIIQTAVNAGADVNLITNNQSLTGAVQDIDGFLFSYCEKTAEERTSEVLIIDGFSDFFDRVSNEALDAFTECVTNKQGGTIITIDNMSRIQNYEYTTAYKLFVRCEKGIVVGGHTDAAESNLLNQNLYQVEADFREKELSSNQGLMYCSNHASYIDLSGR